MSITNDPLVVRPLIVGVATVMRELARITNAPESGSNYLGFETHVNLPTSKGLVDAVGNLGPIERDNGVRTRYAFGERNRLSDLVHERPGVGGSVSGTTTELSRFHYTVREDGKRTGLNENLLSAPDALTGQPRTSTRGISYAYDNAGRLTGKIGQDGRGASYQNTWGLDGVGNCTARANARAFPEFCGGGGSYKYLQEPYLRRRTYSHGFQAAAPGAKTQEMLVRLP